MMKGFGVNTFVLVNSDGLRTFVKFHWKPHLGTHALVWDEALKLQGHDPDFLRRDLAECVQIYIIPAIHSRQSQGYRDGSLPQVGARSTAHQ